MFDHQSGRRCAATLGKLFTPMYYCHQAAQLSTGQAAVMPCGWEGNRRSGVALATRHRLQWLIHLPAHDLMKGEQHLANTPHGVRHTTYLPTWRSTLPVVVEVDGGAAAEQCRHDVRVLIQHGNQQRRVSVVGQQVHVGAGVQQGRHHGVVAVLRRVMQCRPAGRVRPTRRRRAATAAHQQRLHQPVIDKPRLGQLSLASPSGVA